MAKNRTENAPESEAKKSRGLASYILWAFVVVMVYVLSSGPAPLIVYDGTISSKALVIYEPLYFVHKHTLLHKPIGMYRHLWLPFRFDKNGDLK